MVAGEPYVGHCRRRADFGGTVGWSQYEGYTSEKAVAAANTYDGLLQERESGEAAEELALISAGLRETHEGEAFAEFASLQVAAAAVEAGDLELARAELESVKASVEADSTLGQLVQLRLARVMAASGDEAAAVAILEQGSSSFPASCAQARGAIHFAAGRGAEALVAYQSAQTESLALGGQLGLLDLKVSGLSLRDAEDSSEDSQ